MKNLGKSLLCGIAAMFALSAFASAPSSISEFVPMTMNYQGYLANPSTGAAYTDGIYDIQCRLYTSASGGTAIWGAQYSVYVKDGYFNIMLGDSSSSTVKSTVSGSGSTTYGKDYLWKALLDTSYNSLYLGVTPLQGPTHAAIASPSEISPRQQLLTGPYAFRAQSAKYAEASLGNFSVGGNLTVTGSVSFPSSYSLGSYLSVSSSSAKFGGSSNASSNPTTYLYGSSLYGYGYNGLYLSTSAGNMTFSTPSSKSFQFNTGSFAVTNSNAIALRSKNIKIDSTSELSARGSSVSIEGTSSSAVLHGKTYAEISSETSNVYLEPATNCYVQGQGRVYWKNPGEVGPYSPFTMVSKTLTISAGGTYATADVTSLAPSHKHHYFVGGYDLTGVNIGVRGIRCYTYTTGGQTQYRVRVDLAGTVPNGSSASITVKCIGIHNAFTNGTF